MVLSHKDDKHFVRCIWKSRTHALPCINKIVLNAYGDRIKIFGYKFHEFPPSDFYLKVSPHTPNLTCLFLLSAKYRRFYKDDYVNEDVFGELLDHLFMSAHYYNSTTPQKLCQKDLC